jgi:glycosyltransferase involved in cell wall biosynthesis
LRILMLAQFYAPIVGGEERAVQDLSVALARRGHEVSVATLAQDGLPSYEGRDGVTIHRLRGSFQRMGRLFSDVGRRHVPPIPDPEVVRSLHQVIREERPDVIHAHNWFVHSMAPLRRLRAAPLVLSLHDYSLTCANKRLMQKEIVPCSGPGLRKCVSCARSQYGDLKGISTALSIRATAPLLRAAVDLFLPVSEAVALRTGLVGSDAPYQVMPNFLPDRVFSVPAEHEDKVAGKDLPSAGFLLFVGDLAHDKGADVLLDAYRQLRDAPPLVLIGRPLSAALRDAPPNVTILGPRSHATVLEAWRRCSVAVVPSIVQETFGIAALEAMSMSAPVVAAESGFLPELVVDGVTGIVTPPGRPAELAAALARLVADPGLRRSMGEAGRRRALLFTEAAVVPRVERVYRELVDEPLSVLQGAVR